MFAWVQSCAPRSYLVHSGSRGFTQTLILVLVYIRVRVGSLGRDMGGRVRVGSLSCSLKSLGSFWFAWVHSAAPRHAKLIRVRVDSLRPPRGRWVNSSLRESNRAHAVVVGFIVVRVGSLRCAWGWSGSFRFAWVQSVGAMGRRVYSRVCAV